MNRSKRMIAGMGLLTFAVISIACSRLAGMGIAASVACGFFVAALETLLMSWALRGRVPLAARQVGKWNSLGLAGLMLALAAMSVAQPLPGQSLIVLLLLISAGLSSIAAWMFWSEERRSAAASSTTRS